ncbi:MAG: SpoIID/LytB domain-containing protein [Mycobacteriales bacterium]
MSRLAARLGVTLAALTTAAASLVVASGPAGASEVIWPGTSSSLSVVGHGWGHGHGLSQYGARGAALKGVTSAQILSFYYPGTTATTQASSQVRVQITANAGRPVIVSSQTGLLMRDVVTGGTRPLSTSYAKWRIGYSTTYGYVLQYLSAGSWHSFLNTSHQISFAGPSTLRLWFAPTPTVDFTYVRSTAYREELRAVANGSSMMTVNAVTMDLYLRSVVPRESPASWPAAALQAQAVAARSYSSYQRVSHAGNLFDVYDTTQDQVYGGYATYSSSAAGGVVQEQVSTTTAISATANQVRTYGGRAIFAQFSSSNGGFTATGSQPYLRAAADPWEQYSGNPYASWSATAALSSLRALSGLKSIDHIYIYRQATTGGHVSTVQFVGLNSSNQAATVNKTGNDVRSYFGWRSDYFGFVSNGSTDGGPTGAWPLVGDQIFAAQGSARVINGVSSAQAGYRGSIQAIQREVAVTQTGIYDSATVNGVYHWQWLVGLPGNGIVDAKTWQTMTVR